MNENGQAIQPVECCHCSVASTGVCQDFSFELKSIVIPLVLRFAAATLTVPSAPFH